MGLCVVYRKTGYELDDRPSIKTSVWQMTLPERKNAATFIQYTTVRPFIFMGTCFKCFYCAEYFSKLPLLLEHTSDHKIPEEDVLLDKYVHKEKRVLQVDISNLHCRLCKTKFPDLQTIKDHLINQHEKPFFPASNGMTEYNMELKNGAFVCHICDRDFHTFSLLNSHMNCHVGKVVCETCGAGFLNKYFLLKHKETHLDNKFNCKECDAVFVKKSQLKYHTKIVHKGQARVKPKKCPQCDETFKEHYSKVIHLKDVHGISQTFECHICKAKFTSRWAITQHTTRYHTEKYKCEICSKCFSIESKLKQHMRGHTGERNFICPICKNAYMHKMTLRKHMRSHSSVFKFVCAECGSGFQNKNDFVKHTKQWHAPSSELITRCDSGLETSIWQMTVPERKNAASFIMYTTVRPFIFMGSSFKCFYCMEYHSEVPALLQHTSEHKIKENFKVILEKYVHKGKRTLQVDISNLSCRFCGQEFSNLDSVREHLKMGHEIEFFPATNGMTEYNLELKNGAFCCHICNSEFHTFPLLNAHMNCHVGKVVCETCGAGFLNQHFLMKHKETHFNIKFNCKHCDAVFTKKSQLKYHTEIIHKGKARVKPKKCPKCDQTFKEHYSKMVHLKDIHGITKIFSCHLCPATFTTRRAITQHNTRFHTEKFKCDVCAKCFSIESKLKQHLRGHTGERNFICPICKNAYMHKMTLRKHMRSHSSMFKFVCAECGSGFHNKNDFVKHTKQWHASYGEMVPS